MRSPCTVLLSMELASTHPEGTDEIDTLLPPL
jgi:hypothetical protein